MILAPTTDPTLVSFFNTLQNELNSRKPDQQLLSDPDALKVLRKSPTSVQIVLKGPPIMVNGLHAIKHSCYVWELSQDGEALILTIDQKHYIEEDLFVALSDAILLAWEQLTQRPVTGQHVLTKRFVTLLAEHMKNNPFRPTYQIIQESATSPQQVTLEFLFRGCHQQPVIIQITLTRHNAQDECTMMLDNQSSYPLDEGAEHFLNYLIEITSATRCKN